MAAPVGSTVVPGNRPAEPVRPGLRRDRLVKRLQQLPSGGVALVVAPYGYGGTVLLTEAAARSTASPVWLPGPARVGGGPTFWAAAHAALSAAGVAPPPLPVQHGPGQWEPFAEELAHRLAAESDLLLLIEDLGPDPALDQELQVLVDALPETARLMIRARRTPHLDLARHLARGRLVLLERPDLSLDPTEADEYVRSLAPHLPPGRREALIEHSEGWIGALHAALRGAVQDPAVAVDPAAWLLGPGLGLMFARWISKLDAQDVDLLVRTSVLELLTPESCDRLAGHSDSRSRLGRLAEQQVVARAAGAAGVQYRCHGLLRRYLQGELAARGGDEVAGVQRELGRWLAEQGDIEGAITHTLASGQIDEARELLDAHVGTLIDSGRCTVVRDWYRREPSLARRSGHVGILAAAWSELLSGHVAEAESNLVELDGAVAERAFQAADAGTISPGVEWLRTEADYLRAHVLAWGGSTDRAQELVHQVRSRFADEWDRTAPQSAAVMEVRLDLWNGQDESARAELLALDARPGTMDCFRRLALPSLRAHLAAKDGRAHRARFLADQALAVAAETGVVGLVDDGDALLARATAFIDLAEDRLALKDAAELEDRAARAGHVTYQAMAASLRALAWAGCSDGDDAQMELEEARQILRERAAGRSLRAAVDAVGVEIAVRTGDRKAAKRDLHALPEGPVRDRLAVRVAGMTAGVPYADAMRLVRNARPSVPRDLIDARLLMAAVTTETRGTEAESHLSAAAAIAHEFGMRRALLGRPEALQVMAARMAQRDPSPAIAALVAGATAQATSATRTDEPPRLSPGERELLDALAEASAYRELAEALGVSVNTVKTRLRRLYGKLDAHDRETALRRVGKLP